MEVQDSLYPCLNKMKKQYLKTLKKNIFHTKHRIWKRNIDNKKTEIPWEFFKCLYHEVFYVRLVIMRRTSRKKKMIVIFCLSFTHARLMGLNISNIYISYNNLNPYKYQQNFVVKRKTTCLMVLRLYHQFQFSLK